jgi:hypothetical protein
MAYTTINKSGDYFNTKLYTGNESTRSETGVGFQPDFTWIKVRSRADPHILTDAVRGTSSQLSSDTTGAQQTFSNMITSFDSDGFSLGANVDVNRNSETFASWNWKANGAGSANTDGSINTTATSANTTAGFSISKYTGTGSAGTIGHGLGAEPHVVIVKKLNSSEQWFSYHKPLGNTGALVLNTSAAVVNDAGYWNSTTPTSSVFSVTSNGSNNASGDTYMAYCFAPKTGYSKFGSYTGNGNADGTFVYTGFKPAFIIVKPISGAEHWTMFDNKRLGYNPDNNQLYPNLNSPDATDDELDILSNGFKIRSTTGRLNTSGVSHIYMAFAEAPLVGTNNVPANAR